MSVFIKENSHTQPIRFTGYDFGNTAFGPVDQNNPLLANKIPSPKSPKQKSPKQKSPEAILIRPAFGEPYYYKPKIQFVSPPVKKPDSWTGEEYTDLRKATNMEFKSNAPENCPSWGKMPKDDCSKQYKGIFHPDKNSGCIKQSTKKFQLLSEHCDDKKKVGGNKSRKNKRSNNKSRKNKRNNNKKSRKNI